MNNLNTTTNGGLQFKTTKSDVLDLFFIAGNSSQIDSSLFASKVEAAFKEDPLLTTKLMFWSRDPRGGAGQKFGFINWFKTFYNTEFKDNFLSLIPEYGYWKDLVNLYEIEHFKNTILNIFLNELIQKTPNGLVCKWLPRKGPLFNDLRRILKVTPKELRKILVNNSDTTEQRMSANKWTTIHYPHVPSKCMLNNYGAFYKHDKSRFEQYLEDLKTGKTKINSSVLFPSDIIGKYTNNNCQNFINKFCLSIGLTVNDTLEEMWKALPNFLENSTESFLVLADMSSSMFGPPVAINSSIALAIYLSERNNSVFKNKFITFDTESKWHSIQGATLLDKITDCLNSPWGGSTNLHSAFKLILDTAVQYNIPNDELPKNLLIISDMQFDSIGIKKTITEHTIKSFEKAGYKAPTLIFWNLGNSAKGMPATQFKDNVILLSGYSPAVLTGLLKGNLNPMTAMLEVLNAPRYDMVERRFKSLKK